MACAEVKNQVDAVYVFYVQCSYDCFSLAQRHEERAIQTREIASSLASVMLRDGHHHLARGELIDVFDMYSCFIWLGKLGPVSFIVKRGSDTSEDNESLSSHGSRRGEGSLLKS